MGKRSRKRGAPGAAPSPAPARETTAAPPRPAGAPVRRKATLDELPKPPWAPFPLVELAVLLGLVLLVLGLVVGSDRRVACIMGGIGLICVAGLEQAIREHFAGFRSHSTLLAGAAAAVVTGLSAALGLARPVALVAGVVVLAAGFLLLRRTFMARSGGLGFRA